MYIKETEYESVAWIILVQGKVKSRSFVKSVTQLRDP